MQLFSEKKEVRRDNVFFLEEKAQKKTKKQKQKKNQHGFVISFLVAQIIWREAREIKIFFKC